MSRRAARYAEGLLAGAAVLSSVGCVRAPRAIEVPAVRAVDSAPSPDDLLALPLSRPLEGRELQQGTSAGASPLVEWGVAPPGTIHAPRARRFDLQHQIIRVRFDMERRAVVGSTTLRMTALAAPAADASGAVDPPSPLSVVLDAVGMTIARVAGGDDSPLRYDYDGRTLTVHLDQPLTDTASVVTIEYEARDPRRGAYFSSARGIVWTHGRPQDTRYWVPAFDDPGDRTTWEMYVRTAPGRMALANGRLVSSRRVDGGMEWHWSLESPAPAYLMSVVIGDYVVLQDRWRDVPVSYWTYGDSIGAAWRGFGKTPRMMDALLALTGVPYPWAKYDQVVVPDFLHGAMANVTASTFADDALLHPEWAVPHAGQASEQLVMHALAHHWFGSLVSMRDWSQAWLDEGFARMLEAEWSEVEHGLDEAEYARLLVREAALGADARARRPLVYSRWQNDPRELLVTGHVESRGAAVLEMLRAEVGDTLFAEGVSRYLDEHRFGSVETADLRAAIEAASGRDLSRFFRQWVFGAGHPAFRVAFDFDSASLTLALEVSQVHPRDSLTGYFEAPIGVTVLTDGGEVRTSIMTRDSVTRASMRLDGEPRAIVWGSDERTLHLTDFPRPPVMLAYQLAQASPVPARIEAVHALADHLAEPTAVRSLARAVRSDAFWGVRVRATTVLGGAIANADSALVAILEATGDRDARVRAAAAGALGVLAVADPMLIPLAFERRAPATDALRAERTARLEALISTDQSRHVRGAAVRSLATLDRERGLRAVRAMLSRESWTDLERRAAVEALAVVRGPVARELAREALRAAHPATRAAAVETFTTLGAEHRVETGALLRPLLGDESVLVRLAVARALDSLRDPGALGDLEARLAVEWDPAVRAALERGIDRLRGGIKD